MAITYEVQYNDPLSGWMMYAIVDTNNIAQARRYRERGIRGTGRRFRIVKITTTKKVVR